MTPDEAIRIVKSKANGRTRYAGQEPFLDEVLVAEIDRLREQYARLQDEILNLYKRTENPVTPAGGFLLKETYNDPAPETTPSETKATAKHAPKHNSARGGWFHPPIDEDILSRDV